eukprot:gene11067-18674_t
MSQIERVGIHSVDASTFNAAVGLPPPLKDAEVEHRISELTPRYDRKKTLGYAIARTVPTFVTLHRVLSEAAARDPTLKVWPGHMNSGVLPAAEA